MSAPHRAPSNRAPFRVGNDVVDLAHPRCRRRPSSDRLPGRILSGRELQWLAEARAGVERNRRLWSLWAGKETAFKVATKVRGSPPVFHHRAFEVDLVERWEEGVIRLEGLARWDGLDIRVEGVATGQFVHLVGWGPVGAGSAAPVLEMGVEGCATRTAPAFLPRSELGEIEAASAEKARGVHGPLSRRARMVARTRLAGHLVRLEEGASTSRPRVEILTSGERPGRTPPRVVVDGVPRPELDLSLSHHGRYVGWAILLPPRPPDQNPGR